jgi:isopentenyl diphosphate isomerase/L-lactate dehydrogenase-like FMN-dependent dehydrogenase
VSAVEPKPWLDLFPFGDRGMVREWVDRATDAGCSGLVFTTDIALPGNRERERRAGFVAPPRATPRNVLDALRHPRWTGRLLRHRRVTLRNFDPATPPIWRFRKASAHSTSSAIGSLNASLVWDDLAAIRDRWKGPLAVKGPVQPEDARRMIDCGVDVIVASNHGGRQLDGIQPPLEQLQRIVDAVGSDADIVVDGGIRRGTDIAKALCLGAKACMIGRPWVYGLAAGGTEGVDRVLRILTRELATTIGLLGASTVGELDESFVALAGLRPLPPRGGEVLDLESNVVPAFGTPT